jgi:perosamine synthetase
MIPVNTPYFGGNEKKYLCECIDTGWISSEGEFVIRFEECFSQYVGRKYGIAVCNGTAALELAVTALKLEPGGEVIIPAFTIISCALAVIRAGLKPVLVDSDPVNWNMDVSQIEKKINSNTEAIMVVHTYGLPVNMEPVLDLAKKHDLRIIEDAAEMHGQTYMGKRCGGFGDISIFSFYPNKHITTGEGGMVVCDDEKLAERCRSLRNLCFHPKKRFVHYELGYNFRMTNLQAAVGLAQFEQIDSFIQKKREIGRHYTNLLSDLQELTLMVPKTTYADNIYWVYGVVINREIGLHADEVMSELKKRDIGSRPFFFPMHKQPIFIQMGLFRNESYPVSEYLAAKGFYLPCGLGLEISQIDQVASSLREILNRHS